MTSRAPYPSQPPHEHAGPGSTPETPGRRRFRPRNLLPLGVAAFALLEIWLLTLVADAASGSAVLVLIVAGFVLGSLAIKRAGRRAWSNLTRSVQRAQAEAQGHAPEPGTEEPSRRGNASAMLGGLLLMIPGLITDVAGLLLLFPPTAALARRALHGWLGRRQAAPGSVGDAYRKARTAEEQIRIHRPDGKVVEGEVVEGHVVRDDDGPAGR